MKVGILLDAEMESKNTNKNGIPMRELFSVYMGRFYPLYC